MQGEIQEDEYPSEAVMRLVAYQEECPVTKLGDLRKSIDVEKFNDYQNLPKEFEYCGYEIAVSADGTIDIEP